MEINPNSGKQSKDTDTGNLSKQSKLNEECKETQIPQKNWIVRNHENTIKLK